MLSDEQPAVGSMMNTEDVVDMERQPWRFDTDAMPSDEDTLQIAPGFAPEPPPVRVVPPAPYVPAGPVGPVEPVEPRRPLRRADQEPPPTSDLDVGRGTTFGGR